MKRKASNKYDIIKQLVEEFLSLNCDLRKIEFYLNELKNLFPTDEDFKKEVIFSDEEEVDTILYKVINFCSDNILELFLRYPFDIEAMTSEELETLLYSTFFLRSTSNYKPDISRKMELLLNKGANPNITDINGCPLIHQIIEDEYDNYQLLKLILGYKIDVNVKNENTGLTAAETVIQLLNKEPVKKAHYFREVLDLLISKGANLNLKKITQQELDTLLKNSVTYLEKTTILSFNQILVGNYFLPILEDVEVKIPYIKLLPGVKIEVDLRGILTKNSCIINHENTLFNLTETSLENVYFRAPLIAPFCLHQTKFINTTIIIHESLLKEFSPEQLQGINPIIIKTFFAQNLLISKNKHELNNLGICNGIAIKQAIFNIFSKNEKDFTTELNFCYFNYSSSFNEEVQFYQTFLQGNRHFRSIINYKKSIIEQLTISEDISIMGISIGTQNSSHLVTLDIIRNSSDNTITGYKFFDPNLGVSPIMDKEEMDKLLLSVINQYKIVIFKSQNTVVTFKNIESILNNMGFCEIKNYNDFGLLINLYTEIANNYPEPFCIIKSLKDLDNKGYNLLNIKDLFYKLFAINENKYLNPFLIEFIINRQNKIGDFQFLELVANNPQLCQNLLNKGFNEDLLNFYILRSYICQNDLSTTEAFLTQNKVNLNYPFKKDLFCTALLSAYPTEFVALLVKFNLNVVQKIAKDNASKILKLIINKCDIKLFNIITDYKINVIGGNGQNQIGFILKSFTDKQFPIAQGIIQFAEKNYGNFSEFDKRMLFYYIFSQNYFSLDKLSNPNIFKDLIRFYFNKLSSFIDKDCKYTLCPDLFTFSSKQQANLFAVVVEGFISYTNKDNSVTVDLEKMTLQNFIDINQNLANNKLFEDFKILFKLAKINSNGLFKDLVSFKMGIEELSAISI